MILCSFHRQTKNLRTLLFPVLWLDQAALINSNGMHKFWSSYYSIDIGLHILGYCLIGLGALIVIIVIAYQLRKKVKGGKGLKKVSKYRFHLPHSPHSFINSLM